MLKKRIAAIVVVKDGIVVQSIQFKKYLPVGKPEIALEFLNSWGIDEIILLDISASKNNSDPNYQMIKNASRRSYVPLTVGGGITKIDHIKELMHAGADKISLNQSALYNKKLISEAAHIFGNQCVVISIDAIRDGNDYKVYDYKNKTKLKFSPKEFAKIVWEEGAGEILINSVDRDGTYTGYDFELIQSVCEVVNVPVICSGGAKNANDFIAALQKTTVSAVAAANFFHFTEHSVSISKSIVNKSTQVRIENPATYEDSNFDEEHRLLKKADSILEQMLYIKIEKEVI